MWPGKYIRVILSSRVLNEGLKGTSVRMQQTRLMI